MKYYGIFYKDGNKWRGPLGEDAFNKSDALENLPYVKKILKKKVELRLATWKRVTNVK